MTGKLFITTGRMIIRQRHDYELFNLADDPYENENLAANKPSMLKKMMESMVASLKSESALYPVNADGSEIRPEIP